MGDEASEKVSLRSVFGLIAVMHAETIAKQRSQSRIEWFTGAQETIIHAMPGTLSADLVKKLAERFHVALAKRTGITRERTGEFQTFKSCGAAKRKVQFVVIHDMQNQDIVATLA